MDQTRMRPLSLLLLFTSLICLSLGAPPYLDQRQDGKLNLQANLDNFLILIATSPSKSSSGSDLGDFGIFGELPSQLFDGKTSGAFGVVPHQESHHQQQQHQQQQQQINPAQHHHHHEGQAELTSDAKLSGESPKHPEETKKPAPLYHQDGEEQHRHHHRLEHQDSSSSTSSSKKQVEPEEASPSIVEVPSDNSQNRAARSQKHNHKHKVIDKSEPLASKQQGKVPTVPDKSEPLVPKPIKFDLEATVHEITDKRPATVAVSIGNSKEQKLRRHQQQELQSNNNNKAIISSNKEKDSREIYDGEQQQDGFPSLLELDRSDCGPGAVRSSVGICELLDGNKSN